jgi:hypothetical protein
MSSTNDQMWEDVIDAEAATQRYVALVQQRYSEGQGGLSYSLRPSTPVWVMPKKVAISTNQSVRSLQRQTVSYAVINAPIDMSGLFATWY